MGNNNSDHLAAPTSPKLVQRRANRNSSFRSGRTIGEKRERLETANERAAARKKDKRKQASRVFLTLIGFAALAAILVVIGMQFLHDETTPVETVQLEASINPTVEIIDEDSTSGNQITSRMYTYIGQAEQDLKDLGHNPVKVVVPSGTIREIDFYLDGYTGYIKFFIDRDSAISAEDADRMIRYLSSIGVNDFAYIDVRIDGKAYWK